MNTKTIFNEIFNEFERKRKFAIYEDGERITNEISLPIDSNDYRVDFSYIVESFTPLYPIIDIKDNEHNKEYTFIFYNTCEMYHKVLDSTFGEKPTGEDWVFFESELDLLSFDQKFGATATMKDDSKFMTCYVKNGKRTIVLPKISAEKFDSIGETIKFVRDKFKEKKAELFLGQDC